MNKYNQYSKAQAAIKAYQAQAESFARLPVEKESDALYWKREANNARVAALVLTIGLDNIQTILGTESHYMHANAIPFPEVFPGRE